jgi:NAD(P)-dependent dehydrogenase (short-subunit alcohol dehydrogenase family)
MRTVAIELAPSKITVNAVLPGNVLTEGLADLGDECIVADVAGLNPVMPIGAAHRSACRPFRALPRWIFRGSVSIYQIPV